ncbi:MAG: M20/M25/M40 family metallo-hydrolase [Vicinamibacterales bacterium]
MTTTRLRRTVGIVAAVVPLVSAVLFGQASWLDAYRPATAKIIAEATANSGSAGWARLAELTDSFPARLSGSASLEQAIQWAADQMRRDGLENVRIEKVMVPHWVRGAESGAIVSPNPQPILIAALGGSIGTGPAGVQAEVLVVRSFDELESKAGLATGKIVLYNVSFRTDVDPLTAYQEGTEYRRSGAPRAAAHGAVAALVRSIGPIGDRTLHTGNMNYASGTARIPVAATTAEDAERLQRMQDRGQATVIRLVLNAQTLPDVESGNVVAELRGRDLPDEIVLVGGHLDSWDLGSGAMDDGGGCVVTWEALRVLKKLGLRPRRTIRLVLFTNEENGTRGGQGYRDRHADELSKHVLMLESDNGVLPLKGFGFSGSDRARAVVTEIASLMQTIGGDQITDHFDGADIQPSVTAAGIPAISPEVDMARYFMIHHTAADTVEKIVPSDLGRLVGAVASMAYVVADMPQTLERARPVSPR